MCTAIGPTEGQLVTTISAVTDATHITTAAPATQAMSGVSQRCTYGSDVTMELQAVFDYGKNNNVRVYVPAGTYLISSGLTCLPPATANGQRVPGPLCELDPGAVIMAMAPITSMLTYGSSNPNYSGFLRESYVGGGTLDGNFVANYGADFPFFNTTTRRNQVTKNTLLAGVRWGSISAPSASGGGLDLDVKHIRDVSYVTVTAITKADLAAVKTQWDHGYSTGDVVTLVGVSGMTEANLKFFRITRTGTTTFTLDNTNSSSWGTFTGTARVAKTMPSMKVPQFVSAITNANPGVVTTTTDHGIGSDQQIWLADVKGINLGGVYCAKGVTGTTFQLYDSGCSSAINTISLGTFAGNGSVVPYADPAMVEKAVYYENAVDMDMISAQISGVRYGIYANPATAGYDGKVLKPHFYNYNENGELFCAVSLGGDNTIEAAQVDGPVRYAFQFTGPRNSLIGSRLNYSGSLALYPNYASFVRIEESGSVAAIGGGIKGDPAFPVLAEVSRNGSNFVNAPGYSSVGFSAIHVSHVQSASADGARPSGTPLAAEQGDIQLKRLPTSCSGKRSGTLWNHGNVIGICP